jgi:hypothetical protein
VVCELLNDITTGTIVVVDVLVDVLVLVLVDVLVLVQVQIELDYPAPFAILEFHSENVQPVLWVGRQALESPSDNPTVHSPFASLESPLETVHSELVF